MYNFLSKHQHYDIKIFKFKDAIWVSLQSYY